MCGSSNKVVWVGKIDSCQLCRGSFVDDVMYDARIGHVWGNICQVCFTSNGCQLGVGNGQKFKLQDDGSWLMVEGGEDVFGIGG